MSFSPRTLGTKGANTILSELKWSSAPIGGGERRWAQVVLEKEFRNCTRELGGYDVQTVAIAGQLDCNGSPARGGWVELRDKGDIELLDREESKIIYQKYSERNFPMRSDFVTLCESHYSKSSLARKAKQKGCKQPNQTKMGDSMYLAAKPVAAPKMNPELVIHYQCHSNKEDRRRQTAVIDRMQKYVRRGIERPVPVQLINLGTIKLAEFAKLNRNY
ncbi:hypothetical protein COOONC_23812 [Cooperia oncophora]